MAHSRVDKHVSTSRLLATESAPIKRLLKSWTEAVEALVSAWNQDESQGEWPWGYGERSLAGLMAGAAWRIGGVAFEEYAAPRNGSDREGRVDLYVKSKDTELVFEAKRVKPHFRGRLRDPSPELVVKSLIAAERQCGDYGCDGETKVAMAVTTPLFHNLRAATCREEVLRWDADVRERPEVHAHASVYLKRIVQEEFSEWDWLMPGVSVSLRVLRPAVRHEECD